METYLRNSENQAITPKKRAVKPTSTFAYCEDHKQQWPLLKKQVLNALSQEGSKPEEALKTAQDRPEPSLSDPRKRGAGEINPHKENVPENPKRGKMPGRTRVKAVVKRPSIR